MILSLKVEQQSQRLSVCVIGMKQVIILIINIYNCNYYNQEIFNQAEYMQNHQAIYDIFGNFTILYI